MAKKKNAVPKPTKPAMKTRQFTGSGGTVTIVQPAASVPVAVTNGFLAVARGTASVPDSLTDSLAPDDLWLYDTPDLTEVVNAGNIYSKGMPCGQSGGTLSAPVNGTYDWDLSGVLPASEHSPGNGINNNRLWVFAFWQRPDPVMGGSMYLDPDSNDVQYEGVTTELKPKRTAAARKARKNVPVELALPSHKVGHWLHYHDIPVLTPVGGHYLKDERGKELKASRIKVFGFDVNWSYFHPRHPTKIIEVRRPIGPTVSSEEGTAFNSPHNSIIIWQQNWLTRERTVILADLESEADVIELDPTKRIYVTLNYRRLPLKDASVVDGTFGLKVRVLA